MTELRVQLKAFLMEWFAEHLPGNVYLWYDILVLCWIAFFTITLHILLRRIAKHFIQDRFITKQSLQNNNVTSQLILQLVKRLSLLLQGVIVIVQAKLWLAEGDVLLHIIQVITDQWTIILALLCLFTLLDIFQSISNKFSSQVHFPLRGLLQTIKLIASVLTMILAVSLLMDKSPLLLLSGLGALSAVLLLIFKDPILGLVAGIQLSANNMLAVGDWLEMPKYGADGDVVDIALTTVKVRNWDKTITTIPTYALISDSFKNWRGMSESGGRRIKRSIHVEMSSVCFLDQEHITELQKADLLGNYLSTTLSAITEENKTKKTDMAVKLNGRRLTNIGTFRHYLVSFLKQHPHIHQGMTLIVRQLEPNSNGLPIEIYAFTNTTNWNKYEDIQSDVFDHILAVLPEFKLRVHESPTGNDVRLLAKNN